MSVLEKRQDESFADYHIRLFSHLEEYEIDKFKAAELLNKEFGSSYDESKWRKDYQQYCKWKDYIVGKNYDEEVLAKYEELRIESEKEKIRKQDQKREYRKMYYNQARFEKIQEDIKESISSLSQHKSLVHSIPSAPSLSQREGLILFSDWHYGIEVDNKFNTFNKDIFNKRVRKLVDKTIENGKKNEISTLHVAQLGDIISGQIHVSSKVQANEQLIEQITYVSEVLAEVLVELASNFPEVKFYNVIGNHARSGHKNDVSIKENYEYLIPWYLQSRLSPISNIEIISDTDGLIEADICGESIIFAHGNFDSVGNSVKALPQMLGYVPNFIISGHIHHNVEKEFGKTSHIVNPSLIGVDDYAVQKRLFSTPSQKFLLFNKEDGLEATYIIKLNIQS
ncbi:hypothetical protein PQ478_08535 [Alkalihalophilus pseudofirmus]|uniref:hypothetical protein n=1 Tax=Alkalihalophilus pseudofirmus TaxID=79885 RepID=UPI00259B6980|nr:hypothetical protein [Alkalihalophilus pseudofirmus]WEG18515.1 hypothetical protein PQ478_08535 [Alkalihalophilus pseudofirmus]